MKIGIVTATEPATCKVRVQFQDQDAVVSDWLPVMQKKTLRDKDYWMPDFGEHVVCMMDENEEFGVVLGAIYSDADAPPVSSQDKYYIAFDDGTTVEYDRAAHKLKADVKGNVELIASGTLTGTITGETTLTTPTFTINANVVINGMLTQGKGSAGGGATMLGPVVVTNDVTAGGKSLIHHTHPGDSGGTTGQPN
ncbi:MAG: phage baseplate assembly protein V [Chlorobiaceae bacterium]|nr:phage baseplate assembly protein V [Chlorobiaceae bacterium]